MADGTNNMPDQTQALLALQQYTQQRAAGGKPGFIGPLPLEWNASGPFSLQGSIGFLEGMIVKFSKGGKPSLAEKIFESIREGGKKASEGAASMYPVADISPANLGNLSSADTGSGVSYVDAKMASLSDGYGRGE